ncbi:MAG: polysaccharide biosynthesis protein [Oscillospiraceae bacterium]|nr:polysaccharide biosynthesis protein [Oscillospiraceae bacterium]MBQ2383519.1 polysaccharide biosynthesis protein [Oscillospiraceae bacterium]MBQ5711162.1 polysaccharide biosynthesis protein [Oscillospiraceae bacterium]
MARSEVKWGAILSYILIVINAVYGLIITPYVIASIGEVEYGVYKSISSLSTSLLVLDLGLGGTVMRYLAKYRSEGRKDKIEPFVSMAFGEGLIIIVVMGMVCGAMYALLPTMYRNGMSGDEIRLARGLFLGLSVNLVLHIVENLFYGIISGFNRFTFGNSMKLMRIVARMVLLYVLLKIFRSALVLVLVDLVLTLVLLAVEYVYIRRALDVKPRLSFKGWDMAVFGESFKYTLLLFLTSIAAQINNNLDNVVIGAIRGAACVTVYSIGLLIFGMFENLSTAISGVMLPTVTGILAQEDGLKKIQAKIVQVGRVQFALLGAALVGFAVIGRDFLRLWLGDGFGDAYKITLILMIPATLELCVNVCLSVLRAKNMLGFRTAVLTGSTLLNAVVTVIGVYRFGYLAAAVGTALSFIIGSLLAMNIYYHKKLSFHMLSIYRQIFSRIWICLLLAGAAVFVSSRWLLGSGWLSFLGNVAVFCVVYVLTMLAFGANDSEIAMLPFIHKFRNKRK